MFRFKRIKHPRYKYQLTRNYKHQDAIIGLPGCNAEIGYDITSGRALRITPNGILTIDAGYCWDGPSGPTIDTKDFMRGSLVHDALYQFLRDGKFGKPKSKTWKRSRKLADQLLRDICIADGMWRIRAGWVYAAVRAFGAKYAGG